MESVILSTPLLLVGFGLALALCAFGFVKRTGYVIPIVSGVIFTATFTYALLLGATMREVLIVTLVFLAVNMTAFAKGGKQ